MATSYEERRNAIIDEALDATPSVPRLRKLKAKALRQMMMPIYSKREGVYQMDTMEQSDAIKNIQHVNGVSTRSGDNDKINALHDDLKDEYPPYYLILINVNTRKGYAYPMESKNEDSVHKAVNDFYIDVYEFPVGGPHRKPGKALPQRQFLFRGSAGGHLPCLRQKQRIFDAR